MKQIALTKVCDLWLKLRMLASETTRYALVVGESGCISIGRLLSYALVREIVMADLSEAQKTSLPRCI